MSSKPTFGVSVIRSAAKERAESTSLHSTASEIPMSYTAFRNFLKGGKPHPRTLSKLVEWYVGTRSGAAGPSANDVEAAISLLAHHIGRVDESREFSKRLADVIDRLEARATSSRDSASASKKSRPRT